MQQTPHPGPDAPGSGLRPLPARMAGPVRAFVEALRALHADLGLGLPELAERLPAGRSSIARCLAGQGLPDEALLARWCDLGPAGEPHRRRLAELRQRAAEHCAVAEPGPDRPRTAGG
ncbi:hypothetical protein [Kitasatospora camelliae]|uniref:Helix-turn-helix protein n=1 Tax=Kitasatospora camelliae TaxID=3156397 RepID=A0AAU8K3C2_9ACTN